MKTNSIAAISRKEGIIMKNIFMFISITILLQNVANAAVVDVMMGTGTVGGIVTSAVITKNSVDNANKTTNAIIRNLDAQIENIKKNNNLQVIRQPDGTAKVYQNGVEVKSTADPNSAEYKMGLKMAEGVADWMEKKTAKEKLKFIKAEAKADKDKETLVLIKKYKNIDPRVLLEKIEKSKKPN